MLQHDPLSMKKERGMTREAVNFTIVLRRLRENERAEARPRYYGREIANNVAACARRRDGGREEERTCIDIAEICINLVGGAPDAFLSIRLSLFLSSAYTRAFTHRNARHAWAMSRDKAQYNMRRTSRSRNGFSMLESRDLR